MLLTVICSFQLAGQQFGGFPSSTKWRQLNTDTVRVIYTAGAAQQAQRIAGLIHRTAADTLRSLGNRLRKVNVVLHSRTTQANGYVALAPFRSEFYLIPGSNVFDFGNLPWHENLAIHEYRHVHQYNNFRHGISKALSYLFGENGQALGNALSIPDWFFEGDAVYAETALTSQGRGRLPFFLSGYNSLWLEDRHYSWQKLRNGSLKDYVPNHYQLGYLLANYGYARYGTEFWGKVTRDASAFRGLFYPFQRAVKRHAGVDYKTFRNEAFQYYKNYFGTIKDTTAVKQKTVNNYFFPQYIGEDSLLYLKSAYNKLPAFYIRDKNGEHKIGLRSISSEEWFGYRHGKIAYTAYSTNPRWSLVDYSDIVLLDVSNGREKRLTEKKKYFTPDIAPSGKKLVAVRINDSLETELHILNSEDGVVVTSIQHPDYYFTHPRFIDENRIVVGTRLPNSTMALQVLDIASGEWDLLLPFSENSFSLPFVSGNTIYFTSNINGNDDIYAIRLKDKKIYQLTNELTGNYYPSVYRDTLSWSHFTTYGLALRSAPLKFLNWGEINAMQAQETHEIFPVAFKENILDGSRANIPSQPYRKSTGLFRFHSWAPAYADPEFSLSVYSDNILNTFSNELFYRYNQNENSHAVGWNTVYGGWYPMLSAGIDYTYNRHLAFNNNTVTLNQVEARIGYNFPLNYTKGKTYRLFNGGSNVVFNRVIPTGFYKDSFLSDNRFYLHHYITWQHYLPRAVQHIYPKFGYTFSTNLRHFVGDEASGSLNRNAQWLFNGQLFLPSFNNHSIVISGAFQSVDTNSTSFSNRFSNSRGYEDYYFRKMWRLSGNYHFPIAYPDLGIASIVYLQRLRGNVFYDYTRVYSGNFSAPPAASRFLRSMGAEVFFDTRWWNQLPVSFGVRVSYLLDDGFNAADRRGNTWVEFILPVGLIQN